MQRYRVTVPFTGDELLEMIKHKDNPDFERWPSKDFYCTKSAEQYAFMVGLRTGKVCTVRHIDLENEQVKLRDRLKKLWGWE